MECIFCDIVNGKSPAYKIWEDEKHLAFLSIFPNTPGVTVVIPKMHYSSYAFSLPDTVLSSLILASKKVALILDKNLEDVGRTGLVFEGFGIDHIHAKLFPLHGTKTLEEWHPIKSSIKKYFSTYEGYISSHDGERASEEELKKICDELTKNKQG
jgi:diadenosine tetraphosphate (Ap4A) HIT family hydrolase